MFTLKVDAAKLINRTVRMGNEMTTAGEALVKEVALAGLKASVQASPVDTGTLARSWQLTPIRKSGEGISGGYSSNIHYLYAVNYGYRAYGSGRWVAGKFMIEKGETAMEQRAKSSLKKILGRVLKF